MLRLYNMFSKLFNFNKKEPELTIEEKQALLEKLKSELEPEPEVVEPHVEVVKFHVNPKDPTKGYFELDWNTQFVDKLIDNGYNGKTDEEIVAKWFDDLCRGLASENTQPDF